MSDSASPTPPAKRIVELDALRGVALLGILVINIRVFAFPESTLYNPTAFGPFTGVDYWSWTLTDVFARQKFITIFTILYGAGIVLFTRNVAKRGDEPRILFYRRSTWLIVFGLMHAYLLWYGDILVAYGLCGLAVLFVRTLPPRRLAGYGLVLLSIPSILELSTALTAEPAAISGSIVQGSEAIAAELESYRGDWWDQQSHRQPAATERLTGGFVLFTAWRTAGLMLLGMASFKWGLLTNEVSVTTYRRLIAYGSVGGLLPIIVGFWYIHSAAWEPTAILYWRQFNYWGSVPLAFAYVGLVMWWCGQRPDRFLTRALAAVGRTAFSNYILQTILATSVFYGHGLGYFGTLTHLEALGVVVVIWVVQVLLSLGWLRYCRYGPIEWLWRTLTYRSRQPLRNAR